MRITKHRGKRKDNGEWVYGAFYPIKDEDVYFIINNCKSIDFDDGDTTFNGYKVHKKSVGEFTGLYDKNGKEIYDGDIIKWGMHKGSEEYFHRYAVVEFNPDIQFRILFYVNSETGEKKPTDNYIFHFGKFAYSETDKHIEIIGKGFENADLVKL